MFGRMSGIQLRAHPGLRCHCTQRPDHSSGLSGRGSSEAVERRAWLRRGAHPRPQVGVKAGPTGAGTRRVLAVPSNLTLFVAAIGAAGCALAALVLHGLDIQALVANVPTP